MYKITVLLCIAFFTLQTKMFGNSSNFTLLMHKCKYQSYLICKNNRIFRELHAYIIHQLHQKQV